ncbi:hypothetical protein GXW74_19850 [Roseomonas eburnea]|uniref:Uncharacterized protein n=1 Tax=Neoroseomonas eburnea TaxID=1346889 RepID=A0A9X9XGC0_9PROT|nr:hypothetical protein [Neoroseomonas eburnea]MBR0682756.1 hypothetical protein [Neoroseomonas eburnea]
MVVLPVVTRLDVPAERVLSCAMEAGLEKAVVVGWTAEGEFYFASSLADGGEVLWLLEMAKKRLLEAGGG